MTYSLAGRCARTGMMGGVITTSSPAVGSRCLFARAGVGVVLTQNLTDPRLGPRGLMLMEDGCTPAEAIAALVASTPHHGIRQLAALGRDGSSAHFSGAGITSILGAAQGPNSVAVGNILKNDQVPAAMVAAFEAEPGAPLPERLLAALDAGTAAGGEIRELVSAALMVVDRESFPYVDLRADSDPDPAAALRRMWGEYAPLADMYVDRALGKV
ncbi:DUF1028 domain-containing protein [Rhodovarius crocodyli]|uniref:DUF1028 domain-containing protein n=1 Tax=Rhodovarius crocodyli TaxID=1979269 RepID=A0A437M1Y2_9PROT|nr:DUF1028 domain-containing protein [Rhodovarius crocodyli]RVT91698.1 DUF1028 domain-containing protein [Rhodovarius crocodyli]